MLIQIRHISPHRNTLMQNAFPVNISLFGPKLGIKTLFFLMLGKPLQCFFLNFRFFYNFLKNLHIVIFIFKNITMLSFGYYVSISLPFISRMILTVKKIKFIVGQKSAALRAAFLILI